VTPRSISFLPYSLASPFQTAFLSSFPYVPAT
jgi:hypothetical protein